VVIEPRLSLQWYVDMKKIVKPASEAVESDEVMFRPSKYKGVYRHWMDNIRDWCISRQLWWGHRIPAWYYTNADGSEQVFVAETEHEALTLAREQLGIPDLAADQLRQDEDVLDTWFSSWLWPMSVFDGFESQEEVDFYYPTSVLVTGWDIIFLWVARMIMAGYEWRGERPFQDVYFTGMVRDKKRRKMSKSLGNSPDALKLIEDYGADSVRFGMMSCSPAGGDLLFDDKLIETGRNFCNKMWNALRLIKGWKVDETLSQPEESALSGKWIHEALDAQIVQMNQAYQSYRLSEGLTSFYSFVWGEYCSWYLEMIKPDGAVDPSTLNDCISAYSKICQVLHPFMPFITEEIWHRLADRETDCIVTAMESPSSHTLVYEDSVEALKNLVSKIRELRNKNGLKQRESLSLKYLVGNKYEDIWAKAPYQKLLAKLAYVDQPVIVSASEAEELTAFTSGTEKYFTHIESNVDPAEEKARLESELKRLQGFAIGIQKKLSNERFVNNAPAQVVELEKKKLADTESKIDNVQSMLSKL